MEKLRILKYVNVFLITAKSYLESIPIIFVVGKDLDAAFDLTEGIDYTLQISSFQFNRTIRATGSAWGMGGKAIDASWILGKLGIPNRALGFAAGPNALRMQNILHERGVETDFVWVDGETRLNSIIVVSGEGQSTITSLLLIVSFSEQSHEGALQACYT